MFGHRFKVFSDHQPLVWINKTEKLSCRLNRWKIRLENYDFEIVYKPGKENTGADALSRWSDEDTLNYNDEDEYEDFIIATLEMDAFETNNIEISESSFYETMVIEIGYEAESESDTSIITTSSPDTSSSDTQDARIEPSAIEPPLALQEETVNICDTKDQQLDKDLKFITDMIRAHVHDRPKINKFSNQVQRYLYHSYGDLRLVNEIL